METNRQKKIAGIIQKDLAEVIQQALKESGHHNIIVSVTKVSVTPDLSNAKCFLSIFPTQNTAILISEINTASSSIKHQIAQRTRNQLRRMPELRFYVDDSLDYIEGIDNALKGDDNPIEDRDLLPKRKQAGK
ncbi:30S ribosome-binding factor RbfA [Gangjinia marincola]|uniref:Ribosome-binding factor A n=1 Tax=Gangjinia marincola TaxID=578463 RepID=A0ABP3XWC4_9FLAO